MAVTGRGTHPLLSTWLALPGQGAGYVAALGTDPAQQGGAIWLDWQFQGTAAGDLSATLDAATLAAAGVVDVQGTASVTLDDVSLASDASVFVAGVLAAMLGDATLVSAGGEEADPVAGHADLFIIPVAAAGQQHLLFGRATMAALIRESAEPIALLKGTAGANAIPVGTVNIELENA